MVIIHPYSKFLIIFFVGFISPTTIEITLHPRAIKVGDSLSVECKIIGSPMARNFKTQLKCPFYGPEIICITNCETECREDFCNSGAVANQSFFCTPSETLTSLIYSYHFFSLSNSVIKNRTRLQFTCSFLGNSTVGFVEVIHSINTNPNPNKSQITTSTMSSISGSLQLRHMILIGIVSALFISFCVNIWCSVQWCISKSKHRNMKKKILINSPSLYYNIRDDQSGSNCNDSSSHYCSTDIGKKSKPNIIMNNSKMNPIPKLDTNVILSRTDSKNQQSLQSSNEYDLNNESEVNLMSSPLYGPILVTPFHYVDRSMLPYLNPNNHYHLMQIGNDNGKSQSESDILKEEHHVNSQIPGISNSSSGFKKPDEVMSDKDSVFN